MKDFIYFEATEGGLSVIEGIQSPADLSGLHGWMDKDCEVEDKLMVTWMETALVGQKYDHRLGHLVRLMDIQPGKEE